MPRRILFSALALLPSLTTGCLTVNPSFDGAVTGAATTTSTTAPTTSTTSTTSTTEPLTGNTDAASTTAPDPTTIDPNPITGTSTGAAQTSTGTDTSTSTSTSTSTDTEPPSTTGEGEIPLVLEASKTYLPETMWYPGELVLAMPTDILVPAGMTVVIGNAGNHATTLTLTLADLSEVECHYKGGSTQSNPQPDNKAEWEKGLGYLFVDCDDGATSGDIRTVVELRLNVDNGASMQPPDDPQTTVVAQISKA